MPADHVISALGIPVTAGMVVAGLDGLPNSRRVD